MADDREESDVLAGAADGPRDRQPLRAAAGQQRRHVDQRNGVMPRLVHHANTEPPSTTSVWPVMNALSSEARNTTVPSRSSATASRLSEREASTASRWNAAMSGLARTVSLMVRPGAMAFTVIPSGPSSRASARVSAMTAPLDVT